MRPLLSLALVLALVIPACSDNPIDECPDGVMLEGVCTLFDCPGRNCPEDFACLAGDCQELACLDVECNQGELCAGGNCYPVDCLTRSCPGYGEVCVEEQCLPSSCLHLECPLGQRCAAGACFPIDCETHECPGYGEVCVAEECTERTCVGVTCPPSQRCAGGYCYPADCADIGCPEQTQICQDGTCVEGACVNVQCQAGQVCEGGYCVGGGCTGDEDCDDGDPCTVGTCQGDGSCEHLPVDGDGDGHLPETCPGGDDCDDSEANIHPDAVESPQAPGTCNDGLDNDCDGSIDGQDSSCPACQQDADCDDGDPCGVETCQPDGTCLSTPIDVDGDGHSPSSCPNGDDCDDGDPAVHPDVTEGPQGDATCTDTLDNDCDGNADGLDTGCMSCVQDADCDDADVCTGTETCVQPDCVGGQALDCDDAEACTMDGCDPVSGCSNVVEPDGQACGPTGCAALVWYEPSCSNGACTGVTPLEDCVDGDVCTDDSCDDATGCVHTPLGGAIACGPTVCQGLEWTEPRCAAGACTGSTVLADCDDGDSCSTDACDDTGGCSHSSAPDGTGCAAGECCSGACTDTDSDPSNCGVCYQVCNLNHVDQHDCVSGSCRVGTCDPGWGHCDSIHTNGCEQSLSSTSHCGACNNACGSGETCDGTSCRCGTGSACNWNDYCYQGTCYDNPSFSQGPNCADMGVEHPAPDYLSYYQITGRPGATARKYNRKLSCPGATWQEAPESPVTLDASGIYRFESPTNNPITDCSHGNLGRYESYAVVDGIGTSVDYVSYYNSLCPAVDTCTEANSFCP